MGNIQNSSNLFSFTTLNQAISSNTNEFSPSSSSSSSTTSTSSRSNNTISNSSVSPPSSSQLSKREQIIFNSLKEIKMDKYFKNLIENGFDDFLTISKVTPSDLTAIGISDPLDRNHIKSFLNTHFSKLLTLNNDEMVIPNEIESIKDFLKHINLEHYSASIQTHFKSLNDFMSNLNLEDLEEIGVKKLGHQKKLMLSVKRFKHQSHFYKSSNLTKSLENINNLNEKNTNQSVLVKPVPPIRNEKTNYESYSYATLPKKRFNQKFNSIDNADSSILMQQLEATPPAMPLISMSPVINKQSRNKIESSKLKLSMATLNGNGSNNNITNSLIKSVNSKTEKKNVQVTKHVLNDIDSMLCDLNKQLDEMLDYEKVVFRV
jgi:hypothetical protein